MTFKILLPLTFAIASCSHAQTLERQQREEGIYTVRGSAKALSDFHRDVGRGWTGGEVVDDEPSDGRLSYWAYSTRTAAEARALMMPVMMSGLELGIEEYFEATQYKAERKALDTIALKCGATIDPFFLTPMRSVQISIADHGNANVRACLIRGVESELKLPTWNGRAIEKTP